jgi:transcriptional regulator
MYVHPAFKASRDRALRLLRERAFGAFVLPTEAAPTAVHVPFLTYEDDGALRIELHVARANPIHTLIGQGSPALLMCTGPDAYISPDWYGAPNEVTTWTYTAAHLAGTARLMPQSENLAHVDRMVAFFENQMPGKSPWTTARVEPSRVAAMMQAIVTIELRVDDLEAQLKLIQHKDTFRHAGAIAGLRAQPDANSHAIADLMQETVDERAKAARNDAKP